MLFTVLLAYPADWSNVLETYLAHVTADDYQAAIKLARNEAAAANDAPDSAPEFDPILVLYGHHEAVS